MEPCDLAKSAVIDGRTQPNRLSVDGSVLVNRDADEVLVAEAVPQGINPTILLLEVSVKETIGPMKGVCKPFMFTKEVDGRQYTSVEIRYVDERDSVGVSYIE